jgi:casein kinase II subunit beta
MDEFESSATDSDYASSWVSWFLGCKGNEYFCEIDEDYITDRFNLTYLSNEVQHYSDALELITDTFGTSGNRKDIKTLDQSVDVDTREAIEKAGGHLYGLLHARYILTSRGLQKMVLLENLKLISQREKFLKVQFGQCHRVLCRNQPLLPVGLSDTPHTSPVKLYCPRCEDIYVPKSSRHASIDGAYFGTSFPHIFLQCFTNLIPPKTAERVTHAGLCRIINPQYVPKLFGFKVREYAEIHRWQDQVRERLQHKFAAHEDEREEEDDAVG